VVAACAEVETQSYLESIKKDNENTPILAAISDHIFEFTAFKKKNSSFKIIKNAVVLIPNSLRVF
jgi:hypothetical protein